MVCDKAQKISPHLCLEMFFNFFGRERDVALEWQLKPKKFSKDDPHNYGGKCILPQIVLSELTDFEISTPYTFEISHSNEIFKTNCGVLEFTAEDLTVTVPSWMYQQLELGMTDTVLLKQVVLPQGSYLKLLPHSEEFLEIENPKTALEKSLRDYQVLTQGDEIVCILENTTIRFTVAEVKPEGSGIYIVDTDLSVEFLPPIGYEEKLENSKTVTKYLRTYEDDFEPRRIEMSRPGLFFSYESLHKDL